MLRTDVGSSPIKENAKSKMTLKTNTDSLFVPQKPSSSVRLSLFLGLLLLGLLPLALLPGALRALPGTDLAQLHVGATLNGGGHVTLLDLLDSLVGGRNGKSLGNKGNLLNVGRVGLGLTLLGGVGPAGEDNQALLVGLEAGDVGGKGLLALVLTAGVDRDTDGGSELAGDASLLQLSDGEATALTNAAVVADGRAANDGAKLVERTRGDSGGLGLTCDTSRGLLAGLFQGC
jgi:hypothetical protein